MTSLVIADTTFVSLFEPDAPAPAILPGFQAEESEPGSFLLGAFTGFCVAWFINSRFADQGDGMGVFYAFPIGIIVGGLIFYSAGIG